MVEEGHIVGNHTMHHPSMPGVSPDKIKKEIDELSEAYASVTGEEMTYFRPPKGEFSERSLKITSDLGYKTVFWSFAYADWDRSKSYDESRIYDNIMKKLHKGEIMLLHAVSKENANLLEKVIKAIKEKGYEFKSIDDIKQN
jgi:peptidoglycan-N-acetylmuramic acid deacetylase